MRASVMPRIENLEVAVRKAEKEWKGVSRRDVRVWELPTPAPLGA